jgi:hypothetical protein
MTDTQTWAHIKANNNNRSGILMWKSGLGSGAVLSSANAVSAGWPISGTGMYTLDNTKWTGKNLAPGSTTKRTLIFQPGDYYFESINLIDNVNTQILIDTGGLTVTGGNPNRTPVRFFVAGSGSDSIQLQVTQTDPDDSAGLRIYYGKAGSVFSIYRPGSASYSTDWQTNMGVYAVNTSSSSGNGTEIVLWGGTAPGWLTIKGSLLADRVGFKSGCRVISPGESMGRRLDPKIGVGFIGGYSDD